MTHRGRGPIDITIGFSTTNKFMSRVIRFVTRAPCSHAWISFYDATLGMKMVMQAEWWGFELRPWKRWQKENTLVAEFGVYGGGYYSSLTDLAKWLGSRYDFKSALLVGVSSWFKYWFKSKFSIRPSRTPHKLMCAESVVRFLQSNDCSAVYDLDPETTSPGELLKVLSSSKKFLTRGQ